MIKFKVCLTLILSLVPSLSIAESGIKNSAGQFDHFVRQGDPVDFDAWAVPPDVYRQYRDDHEMVPYLNQRLLDQEHADKSFHDNTGLIFGTILGIVGTELVIAWTHK